MKKIKVTIEFQFEVEETISNEIIEEVVGCLDDYGNEIVKHTNTYYDIFNYEESYRIIQDMNIGKIKIEDN